jgi:hypothetical protein
MMSSKLGNAAASAAAYCANCDCAVASSGVVAEPGE